MKELIQNQIEEAIKKARTKKLLPKVSFDEIEIERPKEESFGDLSSNIALKLAAQIEGNSPRNIAETIAKNVKKGSVVEKIEVAGPGFINIFLKPSFIAGQVYEINKWGHQFGAKNIGQGKRILVEFCSPNPTGPMHLGHGRGAFIGDVVGNLLRFEGFDVVKENYINDWGNQIDALGKSVDTWYHRVLLIKKDFPKDGYPGEYVKDIAKEIAEKDDEKWLSYKQKDRIKIFGRLAAHKILGSIREDLEDVGVAFDSWVSESSLREKGMVEEAISLFKKKKLIYKKDGALWFKSTKFGDDKDRVIVKKNGDMTYLGPDIAYHKNKFDRNFDKAIDVLGPDHHGYQGRLNAVAEALGHKGKIDVLIFQLVRLSEEGKTVKMSKRGGTYITLQELVSEIGSDACRYFFLSKSPDTGVDLDLSLAKKHSEKNPVYYIQYACARISSILANASPNILSGHKKAELKGLTHKSELDLVKKLLEMPDTAEKAAIGYAPHILTNYAYEIAAAFHSFYRQQRVITKDLNSSRARIQLILATKTALTNILGILGINCPEKM